MKRPTLTGGDKVDLTPIVEDGDYDYSDDDNMQDLVSFGQGVNLTGVIDSSKVEHHVKEGARINHPVGRNRTGRNLLGYSDFAVIKGRKLLVEKSMTGNQIYVVSLRISTYQSITIKS